MVNILSMYTMRQTRCGSYVSHHCFNLDPSNSNCCMFGSKGMLDKKYTFVCLSSVTKLNLQQTNSDSDVVEKRRKQTKIRTRVHCPSFQFNQPADGLISMLMRLARCLLDQFGLKGTTPAFQLPIRERRKSPVPVRCSPVAPDCAAAAQFNQRRSRARRQTPEEHVRTNTSPSHIIKSTLGPSGFYC